MKFSPEAAMFNTHLTCMVCGEMLHVDKDVLERINWLTNAVDEFMVEHIARHAGMEVRFEVLFKGMTFENETGPYFEISEWRALDEARRQ